MQLTIQNIYRGFVIILSNLLFLSSPFDITFTLSFSLHHLIILLGIRCVFDTYVLYIIIHFQYVYK